jgi:ankyrin repeat protein
MPTSNEPHPANQRAIRRARIALWAGVIVILVVAAQPLVQSGKNRMLIRACLAGNARQAALMLQLGADPNVFEEFDESIPPRKGHLLAYVIGARHYDVARELIGHHANLNDPDRARPPLIAAIDNRQTDLVKDLLDRGADPNSFTTGMYGESALMRACYSSEITALLIQQGAKVRYARRDGATALGRACQVAATPGATSDTAVVAILLKDGASVDQPRSLTDGICRDGPQCASFLRAHRRRDTNFRVMQGPEGTRPESPANEILVLEMLLKHGADINRRDDGRFDPDTKGYTPLMHSVISQPQVIRFLLAHGADVRARTAKGETALIRARFWHQEESVRLLKQAGATE